MATRRFRPESAMLPGNCDRCLSLNPAWAVPWDQRAGGEFLGLICVQLGVCAGHVVATARHPRITLSERMVLFSFAGLRSSAHDATCISVHAADNEAIPCRIAHQRRAVTGGDVRFLVGETPKLQLGTSIL